MEITHETVARSGLGHRLQERARALWEWFFPPEIPLPENVRRALSVLYPRLGPGRASFHRGLPHLLKAIPFQGITLPAAFPPWRARIYLRPGSWAPASVDGLGLLVHEAFHALQVQDCWRGWGLGLVRPFTVLYLACAAGNRFRYGGHPMEDDAYRIAGRRGSRFEAALGSALVARGPERLDLEAFARCCAPAVTEESGLAFWRKLAAGTPGVPALARGIGRLRGGGPLRRAAGALPALLLALLAGLAVAFWLGLWTAATALLWLAQLLVEGLGAAAAGSLWGLSSLLALGAPKDRRPGRRAKIQSS